MEIRKATPEDTKRIVEIYSDARNFMHESGNKTQWTANYPSDELILSDITSGNLYTVTDETEKILACFVYFSGIDETYIKIYGGAWKNELPYGVIHRIAVAKDAHGMGVAKFCFDYAFSLCGNLKIDTHKDNIPMQRALAKCGFEYCGIIHLKSGDERLAFQRVK